MNSLEHILKITDAELDSYVKNGKYRSREEIDNVYKLIDIAKDVYCIWKYEDEEDEMSYAGSYNSYEGGRQGMRSYDGGSSYARGRGRNARRDSMGRYSRAGRDGMSRMYSRDGKEEYLENLREMMEDAPDEQTRMSLKRMIDQMNS